MDETPADRLAFLESMIESLMPPAGSIWDEAQRNRNPGGDPLNFNNESGVTGVY